MGISLIEIRDKIDKIDFEILSLLKERQNYVVSAAQFKDCLEGETGVIVPSRIDSMLKARQEEAIKLGINDKFIDKLFQTIIDYMITLEMQKWKENV